MRAASPDAERLYALLDRYLADGASEGEAAMVRAWLRDDPEHARLLADLRLIRRIAADRPPHSSVDAAWAKAAAVLFPRARRRLLPLGFAAAAIPAAMLLAFIGRGVFRATPPWRELATGAAHRAVVRLRDGTQVVLAPQSRLRYGADYGAAHRDVDLEGQAHFQVAHAAQPFRVHTRGLVAEDLGTAFVVRAYADQLATEVVVAHGRVALWRADTAAPRAPPTLVLAAGDLGRLDTAASATVQHGVNVERYVAWTRGVLVFSGTPLGEVVPALERWYDVEIDLADSALAQRRLTATFDKEPVALVLERIALTLELRVERSGRSVLLSRQ